MNDSIVCEKCNYDLFMICPDGLTVCNHCGEFSSFPTHSPTVPPAIVEPAQEVKPLVFNREHGCLWCKTSIGEYSIRDYFAAKAMQSLIVTLSNSDQADEQMIRLGLCEGEFDKLVAKCAYDYADAMIRSRGNL